MHGVTEAAVARAIADGLLNVGKMGGLKMIPATKAMSAAAVLRPLEFNETAPPVVRTPILSSGSAHVTKAGSVYFVRVSDTVKIGFSARADVSQRLREIKASSPYGLRLIHTVKGTLATEREFHEKFSATRIAGEWFRLTGTLKEWLSGVCQLDKGELLAPRVEKRLTAKQVEKAKPGRWPDGGGLYLDVDGEGRKRWLWRYRRGDKRRDMGLGSAATVSLAEARAERDRWRKVLAEGKDPIEARATSGAAHDDGKNPSFGQIAIDYLSEHEKGWRNEKHRAQWRMTLEVYAKRLWEKPRTGIPALGRLGTPAEAHGCVGEISGPRAGEGASLAEKSALTLSAVTKRRPSRLTILNVPSAIRRSTVRRLTPSLRASSGMGYARRSASSSTTRVMPCAAP